MNRYEMIERVGSEYMTSNIEGGEYSYVQEAGPKATLEKKVGRVFTGRTSFSLRQKDYCYPC